MGMDQAWLIPAIPAAAFAILLIFGPYLPRRGDWLAIAAIGAIFAWGVAKSGSIYPSLFAHVVFNSVSFFIGFTE